MSVLTSSKPSQPAAVNFSALLYPIYDRIGIDPVHAPPLLAVSGGPDSMALAYSFLEWWHHRGWGGTPCHAAIVDHGLRPESAQEAKTVAERLHAMGIAPRVLTVSSLRPGSGIQAWARQRRYHLLAEAALNLSPHAVIMTAHHRGDQAETVAMRLMHGSGLRGLAGITADAVHGGMRVVRPMINLDPAELKALLDEAGIASVNDPSNCDHRFERVRVRDMLSAGGDGLEQHLLRLAKAAGRINTRLMTALEQHIKDKAGVTAQGWGWVSLDLIHDLPPLACQRLLETLIRALGPDNQPRRQAELERLAANLRDGRDVTLGGCEWRLDQSRQRAIICREAESPIPALPIKAGMRGVFDGRWHVEAPVDGEFTAIGPRRFAGLRGLYPAMIDQKGVPARVFWSMPVFTPYHQTDDNELPALEDGSIITHLISMDTIEVGIPIMRFSGSAHWPWPHA